MNSSFDKLILLALLILSSTAQELKIRNSSISAVYVFGDSLVDSGNNNYILTITKSNFPPYGVDFPNSAPTGRFCNGKLISDIIASSLGLKESVPAYLDKSHSMQDFITGVCFASAGSGYDPLTITLYQSISMQRQLEYFDEYKAELEASIGTVRAQSHIQKALFLICSGNNDFGLTYLTVPIVRATYTVDEYEEFILRSTQEFIQVK